MRAAFSRSSFLLLGVVALLGLSACGDTGMTDEDLQELAQTAVTQELASSGSCVSQGYGACTNWSSWSFTGQSCVYTTHCETCVRVQSRECLMQIDPTPECCQWYEPGPTSRESYERFRVCFNEAQQGCTEYETQSYDFCGC